MGEGFLGHPSDQERMKDPSDREEGGSESRLFLRFGVMCMWGGDRGT